MSDQSTDGTNKIVPFAPQSKDTDPLDQSGHTIMALLHQAADIAKANCDRAMDMTHKISGQLHSAEDRIKELEQEARYYQDRAARAEKWLTYISGEIEVKFFESTERQRQQPRS